jgi:hypothetical protein
MGISSLVIQGTWEEAPLRAKAGGVSRQFDRARRIRELALDVDAIVFFGVSGTKAARAACSWPNWQHWHHWSYGPNKSPTDATTWVQPSTGCPLGGAG